MEELKHEQEMRERRNQDREQWRDRHTENSAVSGFTDVKENMSRLFVLIFFYKFLNL